jgi:hypothetical protein
MPLPVVSTVGRLAQVESRARVVLVTRNRRVSQSWRRLPWPSRSGEAGLASRLVVGSNHPHLRFRFVTRVYRFKSDKLRMTFN